MQTPGANKFVVSGNNGSVSKAQFRLGSIVVIILYLVLALAYSVVNPAFESPDEQYHFDYVEELLRSRRLPVAGDELSEFHQPPLYYTTAALLTAWLPLGRPATQVIERNPYWPWRIGEVGVDNKSQFVHGPEQAFPYEGLWRRLHLLRVFSIVLGAWTVWLTGRLALALWPRQVAAALLAMAFVGLLPEFLFVSSSVSNDIAATTLSALILVTLGRFLVAIDPLESDVHSPNTQESDRHSSDLAQPLARAPVHCYRWALLLGALLGSTVLIKMSLLVIWPLVGLILAGYALAARPPRRSQLWRCYLLIACVTLAFAVPYLWRNWRIYGDPTALRPMDAVWGRRNPPLPLGETVLKLPNIWTSFWARFGYGQIPIPNAFYLVGAGLVLLALGGLALAWKQHRPLRRRMGSRFWLLAYAILLILAFLAAVVRYSQTSFNGDFGRFVFPALPAMAVLLAVGWTTALARIRVPRVVTAATLTTILAAFSLWVLVVILRPAYVMPVDAFDVPIDDANTASPSLHLGDVAILHRATVLNPSLAPGGDALVEVELRPLRRTETPLTIFIWLVGPNGERLGDRHSYPGVGRLSTTFWQPGKPFVDLYRVPVDQDLARRIAPAPVEVYVGLYDRFTDKILPVTDSTSSAPIWKPVAEAKVPPLDSEMSSQAGAQAKGAVFGDSLQLNAVTVPPVAHPGSTITVTLAWTILAPAPCDCKLFLHLVGPDDLTPLAQVDELVLQGRYPARLWADGERLQDSHSLRIPQSLPSGVYRLVAGFYRDEPGWPRLTVRAGEGATDENSYVLGVIQVRSQSSKGSP